MAHFIRRLSRALRHPVCWAGFSAPLWGLAAQIGAPWDKPLFVFATLCTLVSIVLRSPTEIEMERMKKRGTVNDDLDTRE